MGSINNCKYELLNLKHSIKTIFLNDELIQQILLFVQCIQILIRFVSHTVDEFELYNFYYLISVFCVLNLNMSLGIFHKFKFIVFMFESIYLMNIMSYKLWFFLYGFYIYILRFDTLGSFVFRFIFQITFSKNNIYFYHLIIIRICIFIYDIVYCEYLLLSSFLNNVVSTFCSSGRSQFSFRITPYKFFVVILWIPDTQLETTFNMICKAVDSEFESTYVYNDIKYMNITSYPDESSVKHKHNYINIELSFKYLSSLKLQFFFTVFFTLLLMYFFYI